MAQQDGVDGGGGVGEGEGRRFPPSEPPEDVVLTEPPSWPKVVGICSIVWGLVSGLCCNVGSGVGMMLMPQLMGNNPDVQQNGGIPPGMAVTPMLLASLSLGLVVSGLLFVAGIMTVGRKPAGRTLHLAYGVLAMVGIVVGVLIQLKMQADMAAFFQQWPKSPFAQGQTGPAKYIGMVLGSVFFMIWPVFCLIWFGLAKKRPEVGYVSLDDVV